MNPTSWPTKEQIIETLAARAYDEKLLHFGVCGPSGSGKSALINGLRGLTSKSLDAAPTGQAETTVAITRYPDARAGTVFERFVWYDIPGAGTANFPAKTYFLDQGLYIFDFLVLVWDTRWTEIDSAILEDARRFGVPLFIVRSKSEQHVENIVKMEQENRDDDDDDDDEEDEEDADRKKQMRKECVRKFIEESNREFNKNVVSVVQAAAEGDTAPPLKLYIVSAHTLRKLVLQKAGAKGKVDVEIDEEDLLKAMLSAAVHRRYMGSVSSRLQRTYDDATKGVVLAVKERATALI